MTGEYHESANSILLTHTLHQPGTATHISKTETMLIMQQ